MVARGWNVDQGSCRCRAGGSSTPAGGVVCALGVRGPAGGWERAAGWADGRAVSDTLLGPEATGRAVGCGRGFQCGSSGRVRTAGIVSGSSLLWGRGLGVWVGVVVDGFVGCLRTVQWTRASSFRCFQAPNTLCLVSWFLRKSFCSA